MTETLAPRDRRRAADHHRLRGRGAEADPGEEGNSDLALRVFVSPGGCSGLSYGMSFEDAPGDDDMIVEREGVRLVVDEVSLMYVQGSEIDYVDALMGGGFTVYNPNAVRSCACGHSFDTGGDAETARACH